MKPVPFDYYVVYSSLWGHRKHLKLKRLLNITDLQAYAIIVSIFRAAAIRETDGDFSQYSAEDLSAVCCWDTPAEETLKALIDCNILTEDKILYSWEERQPIFRARERIKKARERNSNEQNGTVPNCTVQNGTEIHRTAKSKSKSKSESERKSESKEREKEREILKENFENSDLQWTPAKDSEIAMEFCTAIASKTGAVRKSYPKPDTLDRQKLTLICEAFGFDYMRQKIPEFLTALDDLPKSNQSVYIKFTNWLLNYDITKELTIEEALKIAAEQYRKEHPNCG